MDRPEGGLGTGVEPVEHLIRRQPLGPALAIGLERRMYQGVGIAVAHAKLGLEHRHQLPMFGESAALHDRGELGQSLAGSLFDVGQLGGQCLVQIRHKMDSLRSVVVPIRSW